jgi:hypothetical protein
MRARYNVYSNDSVVLETFIGAVFFHHIEHLVMQQVTDPRVLPEYHTVTDLTQATLNITTMEVQRLATLVCNASSRVGKRALVINGARNLAFTDLFAKCLENMNVNVKSFANRDAALGWITTSESIGDNSSAALGQTG